MTKIAFIKNTLLFMGDARGPEILYLSMQFLGGYSCIKGKFQNLSYFKSRLEIVYWCISFMHFDFTVCVYTCILFRLDHGRPNIR